MLKKVNKDITKSYTLPADFYSSKSKFENVVDRIFVGSWQLICTKNSIKSMNDTYVFEFIEDLIPEPLFLINQDDKFKCFSNVCTHRGNVLIDQKDKIKNHITCKYHGRKFNTCGKFVYMPETEGMQNFPTKEDDLMEFPVIVWRQFIFSSLTIPNKAPTFTVSPSFVLIFVSTPFTGEGTSRLTLSVSSSTIGSSAFTLSPDFFSHLETVASVILSPKTGTNISSLILFKYLIYNFFLLGQMSFSITCCWC